MAAIPSIESHLVQLHECLGLPQSPLLAKTETRRGFSDLGLSLEKQEEVFGQVFGDILNSLGLDGEAQAYALHHFLDWANFYKAVQIQTWTGRASEQDVLWSLAGNVHAPSLGRYLAFWAVDHALGRGVPGGEFWFLPTVNPDSGKVDLPVPKVIDWLMDLLQTPMDSLRHGLGKQGPHAPDKADSFERNLYNWRQRLPRMQTIQEMFPDDFDQTNLGQFLGAFAVDASLPLDDRVSAAQRFVQSRGLTAEELRRQIPMTAPGRPKQC